MCFFKLVVYTKSIDKRLWRYSRELNSNEAWINENTKNPKIIH